jgi:alkanesulfonate monooxygenase
MPVEFISATHPTPSTEATGSRRHFGFDVDDTRRFVRYLDDGGFDWTLVAHGSLSADSAQVAQFVVSNSERVKPMLAHRPGFVFPTLAAKSFATIDQIGQGGVGVHIISGGTDAEQLRGWDPLNDAIDYARHALPLVRQELAHRAAATANGH